jgi:hypothetical protein
LATLAQAISNTTPTTAIRIRRESEYSRRSSEIPWPRRQLNTRSLDIPYAFRGWLGAGLLLQQLLEEQVHCRTRLLRTNPVLEAGDKIERLIQFIVVRSSGRAVTVPA